MKEKKPFIIQLVIGIILIGIGLIGQSGYYSTLLFAMGCGIASSMIVQICRMIYWQNPKRCNNIFAFYIPMDGWDDCISCPG